MENIGKENLRGNAQVFCLISYEITSTITWLEFNLADTNSCFIKTKREKEIRSRTCVQNVHASLVITHKCEVCRMSMLKMTNINLPDS